MKGLTSKSDGLLGKFEVYSDDSAGLNSVNRVSISSDEGSTSEDNSDESVVSPSSQLSDLQKPRRSSLLSKDRQRDSTRSVSFSTVQTRVFEVIGVDKNHELDGLNVARPEASNAIDKKPALDYGVDEPEALCDSRNLIWRFTDSVSDIKTHESSKLFMHELDKERRSKYARQIRDCTHITGREDKEREWDRQQKDKNGFKSKVLQTSWKSVKGVLRQTAYIISPIQKR